MMKLGIPVYQGVNILDVMGPLEMFHWASQQADLQIVLISADGAPVTSNSGVTFSAQAGFADVPALDVLWVPGGAPEALAAMMRDAESPYLWYLRQVAAAARMVCSVCEGALLLAQAGLLDGHEATTHWAFVACLQAFPAITVAAGHPRFVLSGNRLTGGGVSSGLDEALGLIALLFGEAVAAFARAQTQYFPLPPVPAEIPVKVPACPVTWN